MKQVSGLDTVHEASSSVTMYITHGIACSQFCPNSRFIVKQAGTTAFKPSVGSVEQSTHKVELFCSFPLQKSAHSCEIAYC